MEQREQVCGCDDCGEPQVCAVGPTESMEVETVKLRVRDVPYVPPKGEVCGNSQNEAPELRIRDAPIPRSITAYRVASQYDTPSGPPEPPVGALPKALTVARRGPVSLLFNSVVRAALDSRARPGTASLLQPWVEALEAKALRAGKYSKGAVLYIPLSPPPVLWDYKCRKCYFWQEGGGCAMVEGKVSPSGWCTLWIPPADYQPLTWPKELASGDW
jgi:hypothetical protein